MRHSLLVLLACALAIALTLWVAALPGNVRIQAGTIVIDAASGTLIVLGLIALAATYASLRAIAMLATLPRRLRHRRTLRRRHQGDRAVTRALAALAAGQQSHALSEATRARRLLGDTAHTLLLDAQAQTLAGQIDQARARYATLAEDPITAPIGLHGLFRLAVDRADWPEAHRLAARAQHTHPQSPWLRDERARLPPIPDPATTQAPPLPPRPSPITLTVPNPQPRLAAWWHARRSPARRD